MAVTGGIFPLPLAKIKFLIIKPKLLPFPAHIQDPKGLCWLSDRGRPEGSGHSRVIVMIISCQTSFPFITYKPCHVAPFRCTKPSAWRFGPSFLLFFQCYFAKCLSFVPAFYHLTDFSFFWEPFVYCHKLLFWLPAFALNFVCDVSLAPTVGGHLPFCHLPGSGSACVCVCRGVKPVPQRNHIRYFIPFNAVAGSFIPYECKLQSPWFLEFRKK